MRLVDVPDGTALKIHHRPVANAGGPAIGLSVFATLLPRATPAGGMLVAALGLLAALALGFLDDLKGLKPLTRLFSQAALGVCIALAGLRPALFSSVFLDCALSACIVAGAINAVNLLDGMDGLACGVTAISCAAFAAFSYAHASPWEFFLAAALLAALVGFLPYNFHPASIFLGNSGSSFAGFSLAALTILALRHNPTPGGCIGALLIIGLPVADTAYAIVRRVLSGKGIMVGDRDHFYDKLLRKGFSQRQSALIGYGAAASCGLLGLAILLL